MRSESKAARMPGASYPSSDTLPLTPRWYCCVVCPASNGVDPASVTLGLSGSTGADRFEDLFDDWLARFAGQIVAPVLDGGRRKLEVEKQQAVVDEALARYRQTVLTALKEVEDALMLEDKVQDQLEALRNELALARQTLSAARNRYANGLSDYLNVTSSLISVQSLERDEITQVANLFKARIALHKALGGQLPEFSI